MRLTLDIPDEVWETRLQALINSLLIAGVAAVKSGDMELAREVHLVSLAYNDLLNTMVEGMKRHNDDTGIA